MFDTSNCQEQFNCATVNKYPQLDNGIHFRPNEINSIKNYFMAEIHIKETMSKTLSKYIVEFNYFD